jgi:hypothetical protein
MDQLNKHIVQHIYDFINKEFNKLSSHFSIVDKSKYSFNNVHPLNWSTIVTYSLHQDINILKKYSNFRKLIVTYLLNIIIKEFNYKNCLFQSVGSTTLTSDYDVSVHGENKETVVVYFNDIFSSIFGAESGDVFDTNLYAVSALQSVARIDPTNDKAYKIIKECDSNKKNKSNKNNNKSKNKSNKCKIYKIVTMPLGVTVDISNQRSWAFIKLFKYITQKEISILKSTFYKSKINLLIGDFENGLERYNNIIKTNTDESLAAMNKKYNLQLNKVKISRKNLEEHPNNILFKINFKDAESEANYYSSESYYTQGAYLHCVADLQSGVTSIRASNNELIDSMLENCGDLFKELNKFEHKESYTKIVIKVSKYWMRIIDALIKINKKDFLSNYNLKKMLKIIDNIRISLRGKILVEKNLSKKLSKNKDEVDIKDANIKVNEMLDLLNIKKNLLHIRTYFFKFIIDVLKEYYLLPHKDMSIKGGNISNVSNMNYKFLQFK